MPKYAVSLGSLNRTVTLEAANPQQALDNVIATIEFQHVAMIPRQDKKESHWFSRNTEEPKDEVLVKDTEAARKLVARVREDVVDVFWFVDLHEHKNKLNKKIR